MSITLPDPSAELESLVLSFCAKHGMPKSRFGEMAMKDPSFVADLSAGREPRRKTIKKVLSFIQAYEGAA